MRQLVPPRLSLEWRSCFAALAFMVSVGAITFLSRQSGTSILTYVLVLSAGSALVSAMLWREKRLSAVVVMLVAIVGHGLALFGDTVFEDDYYRFLWDGWRLLEAGTPYGAAPADFVDDPAVPAAMRDVLEWVNYPELPTIYGPVLQLFFAGTSLLADSDEMGLRLLFAGAALVLTFALLRRHAPERVALFAWNPVVVAESTLHLHPDILMAAFLLAGVLAARRWPVVTGILFAGAAGIKLVALAAWPMLIRLPPRALLSAVLVLLASYGLFAVQGSGVGFDSTQTFATQWYFNPYAFEALLHAFGADWARLAALVIAGLFVLWFHASARPFDDVPLAAIFGIILLFAPAVNGWYILWLLPFALDRREVWPYVASAVLPLSYLTGLNLGDYTLDEFGVHPLAQYVQWLLIAAAIVSDLVQKRRASTMHASTDKTPVEPAVSVIIPALNEEESIGPCVQGIIAASPPGLREVIVADNGSSDATAEKARAAGARVVTEPERGYGAACLAGIAAADPQSTIILFMDADLSDVPEEAADILAPIIAGEADLVIGSRTLGQVEPGAMTLPQRFGNWLAPSLVRLIWGVRYTDLGPFRAIRRDSLCALHMQDRDFGWTVEMQVRAAKQGLRMTERPVSYRKRVGVSKISGTVRGVLAAGWKILFVIAREAFGDFGSRARLTITAPRTCNDRA